jgi:tetratricopeptide (TPR) repeat protein
MGGRIAAYYSEENYDDAILCFTKVINLDTRYAVTYYMRGVVYYMKGDYALAAADFEEAIRIAPDYADPKEGLEASQRELEKRS